MTLRAICFDLDDTLYDYARYARSGLLSAADRLESTTGRRLHDELLDLYFEAGVTEGTFDHLVERHDLPDEVVPQLVDAYHAANGPLEPYPETEPVLSRLGEDHVVGLLTDGRGGHAKLDRLGLREYFDAVLISHSVGRTKHDPVVFERLLVALSVPPTAALYVGDDPRVDFRVPNQLGMDTVRLRRGRYADLEPAEPRAAPDHEIEGLGELLDVLEELRRDEAQAKTSS